MVGAFAGFATYLGLVALGVASPWLQVAAVVLVAVGLMALLGALIGKYLVLPLRGAPALNTLLITLWTFNDFSPYLLTGGGPNRESEILPVYIYKEAIIGGQLGYGSAISLLLLLANLVIALAYVRLLRTREKAAS